MGSYDRCKLYSSRLRHTDQRRPKSEIYICQKVLCANCIRIETFTPSQLKMSIYAKEFLAIYYAFKEFGHIFWGTPKPVIILTDNKSVTRFFQTKIIPPQLWDACDFVIQFNFKSFLLKKTLRRKNTLGNERNNPKSDSRSLSQYFKLMQYQKTLRTKLPISPRNYDERIKYS